MYLFVVLMHIAFIVVIFLAARRAANHGPAYIAFLTPEEEKRPAEPQGEKP